MGEFEDANYLRQFDGLNLHTFGGGGSLFYQGGILLRHFIHVADR